MVIWDVLLGSLVHFHTSRVSVNPIMKLLTWHGRQGQGTVNFLKKKER
jgi:hypothetical protein